MTRQIPAFIRCTLSLLVTGAVHLADAQMAHYPDLQPDRFLKSWVILSPIPVSRQDAPTEQQQKNAFSEDHLAAAGGEATIRPAPGDTVEIQGTPFRWRLITSPDNIVDPSIGDEPEAFSIAYAFAEIHVAQAGPGLLGIGSDDGVRVWLNGEQIHDHWVPRGIVPDDDLVPVRFVQGANRLLIKLQNIEGPWGFACRWLGPDALGARLITSVRQANLSDVRLLLDHDAAVDTRAPGGLTPIQIARIRGDSEMVELLASRGGDRDEPLPMPEALVDHLFTSLFKPDGPAAAVLVARDGRILFEKAYGLADIGNNVPATPETKFRIGSITKQFTGAAILTLREQGRIDIDTKLSRFIPDYPRGDEVTIHHLLTHTSGIHSYTSKPDFLDTVTVGTEPVEHINSFKNAPHDFDPGARFLYNNSGYFLLGYIIEKVSGQSYADYLRQTFFDPLGMQDTGVHEATTILRHEATGYSFQNGAFTKALDWDMSRAGAAGALYSTVRDLYRWNEALFNGRVLGPEGFRDAFIPVVTGEDDPSQPKEEGYGYGWAIQTVRGLREISHSGGLQGFQGHLLRIPSKAFTVAVLLNCSPAPPNAEPGGLARIVTEFYLHEQMAPRERPKVNLAVSIHDLEAVAGRYAYPNNAILIVTREDDKLYAQLTGQSRHQIFPESPTNYFWRVADARVSFVADESGTITAAIHQQAGQRFKAPRIEDLTKVTVDPAVLEDYVGRYDYSGGAGTIIMTITREDNRLFAQLTGQPRFEIFPKSQTEFFWTTVVAQVTFIRDDHGTVTKAVHHQHGQSFDAPRIP
jgi:CubicO group peptidase (beta-lactamase class C family)